MRISDWSSDVCSSDLGWDFKVRGRLQYDFAYVSNPSNGVATNELGFSNELRRGRIGVEGTTPGSFAYKFEADFAGNEVELADAYFQWKGKVAAISFGQHNNFQRSEEHTSELQSLMRISYAVFCLKKKTTN